CRQLAPECAAGHCHQGLDEPGLWALAQHPAEVWPVTRCHYCQRQLDPDSRTTYQAVWGWEPKPQVRPSGAKGGSDITLRRKFDRWSCSDCITKLRAGINPQQEEIGRAS